jgi:hypothetical protein
VASARFNVALPKKKKPCVFGRAVFLLTLSLGRDPRDRGQCGGAGPVLTSLNNLIKHAPGHGSRRALRTLQCSLAGISGTGKCGRLWRVARRPKIRTEISTSASGSIGTEISKSASNSAVRSPDPHNLETQNDQVCSQTNLIRSTAGRGFQYPDLNVDLYPGLDRHHPLALGAFRASKLFGM